MMLNRLVWCAIAVIALQGIATATKASDQDAIVARLDALEKENAALRQRLNRVEHLAVTSQRSVQHGASEQNSPRAARAIELAA